MDRGGADLRFLTIALSRTPAEAARPQIHGQKHCVVYPFTPRLLQVLTTRPRRDCMLNWRWYIEAVGEIRTRDLVITSSAFHQKPIQLQYYI